MTEYTVQVSSFAADQIAAYAFYIAEASRSAVTARRWIDLVYTTIDKLSYMPRRFGFAEENQYRDYDIHRQIIGNYLALYAINDDTKTVQVIGFRWGGRLPRPSELPETIA